MSSPLSSTSLKFSSSAVSYSSISHPKTLNFRLCSCLLSPPCQRRLFCPWNGLKSLGISVKPKSLRIDRKARRKGMVVYASLFGVGAPEALVIGVVALLVFGPKGLAEVARNLGKTLRAFQPTIRELQEVSNEFKSTLEREIGLDDISSPTRNTYNSSIPNNNTNTNPSSTAVVNGTPGPNRAYSTEDYLKITEEQLRASALQKEEQTPSNEEGQSSQIQPPAPKESAITVPQPEKPESET
ncbi:Sec-independent protein translocase protein TATB, chloroplastic [Senna tora]|uniref:Sec-independent protein translocase protein TATB, chloroplastic n=1 Tax=Senna tora TaxID=362788 RepID=A0A834T2L7_9FABA|nr:Sec-independent protein translocase protein TATB, chloroplastic [Senna tora]